MNSTSQRFHECLFPKLTIPDRSHPPFPEDLRPGSEWSFQFHDIAWPLCALPLLLPNSPFFASLGALGLGQSLGGVSAVVTSLDQFVRSFIHSFSKCSASAHKVPALD